MIKRIISLILVLALSMSMFMLVGCGVENNKRTTKDGIVYYLSDESGELGAYILDLPDKEEVVIPEYVDGYKVLKLGYYEKGYMYTKVHTVSESKIKKLTIQHDVVPYSVDFNSLETIIYIDIVYCFITRGIKTLKLSSKHTYSYNQNSCVNIEIQKGNQNYDLSNLLIKCFEIDRNVKVIEAGVFDGLEGVTIRTSYESKPDGWEDGWNGNCQVEWGVNLD